MKNLWHTSQLIILCGMVLTGCNANPFHVNEDSGFVYGYVDGGELGRTSGVTIGHEPVYHHANGRRLEGISQLKDLSGTGHKKVFYVLNVKPGKYYVKSLSFGTVVTTLDMRGPNPNYAEVKAGGFHYMGAMKLNVTKSGLRKRYSIGPVAEPGAYEALQVVYSKLKSTPWGARIQAELARMEAR